MKKIFLTFICLFAIQNKATLTVNTLLTNANNEQNYYKLYNEILEFVQTIENITTSQNVSLRQILDQLPPYNFFVSNYNSNKTLDDFINETFPPLFKKIQPILIDWAAKNINNETLIKFSLDGLYEMIKIIYLDHVFNLPYNDPKNSEEIQNFTKAIKLINLFVENNR